jgi:hypothetical protein
MLRNSVAFAGSTLLAQLFPASLLSAGVPDPRQQAATASTDHLAAMRAQMGSAPIQSQPRDVQGPLVWAHLLQAVQRQIEAFADADSAGTREQECIGGQIIGSAQFLLQELILLRRKRTGQVEGLGREVFLTDEVGRKG